ncbi:MAG TPA: putative sulfate exporter family transporter [Candidatus Limnocylindrales bacterium]|nr:putative sulfate exporter family transporter [Candidatus Limnocylindrales bacterium]
MGLGACVAVAAVARLIGSALQLGLETALALVLGLAVGATSSIRPRLIPGATLASRYALRAGITLLGARLTLGQLLATGAASIVGIVLVVSVALALGTWLARRLGVVPPLSALITVGMAICGNSAILALSPIIGAKHRDTAYAVSTITIFGLIGVLVLPVVGRVFHMSDPVFGTWAGLAVNDTAQVVATGYAFSPGAGDVATVVKLTRNLAILPVLLGATWFVARSAASSTEGATPAAGAGPTPSRLALVSRAVPWFVVGFVVVAGLRSAGLLDVPVPGGGTLADLCSTVAALLILVALAGVGMATDVRSLRAVGGRPFVLAAVMWVVIGLLALVVATTIGGLAGPL